MSILSPFDTANQMKQHLFSERKAHTSAHAANGITSVAFTQRPTLRSDITATSVTNRSAQTASTPMRRQTLVFRSHRHSVTTIFPTGQMRPTPSASGSAISGFPSLRPPTRSHTQPDGARSSLPVLRNLGGATSPLPAPPTRSRTNRPKSNHSQTNTITSPKFHHSRSPSPADFYPPSRIQQILHVVVPMASDACMVLACR